MARAKPDLREVTEHMRQFDPSRYDLKKVIGAGSYGNVFEATDDNANKEKVAVKRVAPEIFRDSLLARRILREIKLLAHFSHENIIGLRDILRPHNANFDMIYIIMDLMETDLKAIFKSGQEISESHAQYFLYQILRGLHCIHRADVIHRDLTPSNILLNTNCDLKICDFGLAREEGKGDQRELTDYVVMRWYRAPELVMEHKHYTSAVDVWAAGCIMGEMFHHAKPVFPGRDRIQQLDVILEVIGTPPEDDINKVGSGAARKYIKRKSKQRGVDFGEFFVSPENRPISPECIDLLKRMLEFSADKRITVHEALNHPYLTDLHDPEEPLGTVAKFRFDDEGLDDVHQVKQMIYDEIILIQRRNENAALQARAATTPEAPVPEPHDGSPPRKDSIGPANVRGDQSGIPRTGLQREDDERSADGAFSEDEELGRD